MDISGAQLNSVAINAYNAQLQAAPQQNQKPATQAPAQQQPSAEVTLSRDGRDRAANTGVDANFGRSSGNSAATAANDSSQPASATRPVQDEIKAALARATESKQQATPAAQQQTNASTYTAQVAAQSYISVSNL